MRDLKKIASDQIEVSPSLLAADFGHAADQLAALAAAKVKVLHLDVMDGHFVPNISFGVPVIASLRKTSDLLFDTHLMISHPLKYAKAFAAAGCDHLTFHVECDDDIDMVIDAIKALDMTVGLSLKPKTPPEVIFPYLDRIDLVLVMTVEPGFGGQSFMTGQMPKVAAIKREIKRRALPVVLEVDGGLDADTVGTAAAHGAHLIVAGTAVFRHPDGMEKAVEVLKAATPMLDSAL